MFLFLADKRIYILFFFFSSRRRHTRLQGDWSSDVCSSDLFCAVAPELFKREGGVGQIPNVQDVLKIVLAQKREQTLGDPKAAADWAKTRPNVKASALGVTG